MSIETIRQLGDDALANLWDMQIGTISFIPDVQSTILRVQNITIPATGANTYEVPYKTQTFTKVGGKVNAPNEFDFEFRVDRNWLIYKGFVAWKNAVANTYTGAIGQDNAISSFRTPITVWAVDGDGTKPAGLGQWIFEGCYPTNISDLAFTYDNGDPLTVTITMNFLRMNDLIL